MYSKRIFISFFVAFSAYAGDDIPVKDKAHAVAKTHQLPTSAQRIFLDPATGQARSPTREERQQLQQQSATAEAAKSAEEPKRVRFSDGSIGVYLKKPKSMLHAQISKNGQIKTYCNDQQPHAHKVQP